PVLGEVAWLPAAVLADERVEAALGAIESFAAHGAKPVLRSLAALGVELPALAIDTQIAAYLLDPAESRYLLEDLLARHAGLTLPAAGEGPAAGQLDLDGDAVPAHVVAARRALAVDRLVAPITAALDA